MWMQILWANWAPCGLSLGPGILDPTAQHMDSLSQCGLSWVVTVVSECTQLCPFSSWPCLPTLFLFWFCFLHSLQWKTAATMNLRSEHFGVPMVDTAKGSGRSGLPREAFFQWTMSFPGQVMEDKFKGLSPEYFTVRIFTKHVPQILCSHHRGG